MDDAIIIQIVEETTNVKVEDESSLIQANEPGARGPSANFTVEALIGAKNGVNRIFTISQIPAGNIDLKWNGLSQLLGRDYTRSGVTITMAVDSVPISTDDLTAIYNF